MPIRMLRTECIAVDGITVRWYREGSILHVPDSLAAALIRDGIATAELKDLPLAHQPKAQMKQGKKREYRG